MASPALFSVVGDSLPSERRTMGFTVQAVVKRIPLAVILSHSFAGLIAAFTVGGLRELGEPARKALILHMAPAELRARAIGLYYFLRSLAIAPAAFIGGLLWKVSPALPFTLAGLIGLTGTAVFIATVDEQHAG